MDITLEHILIALTIVLGLGLLACVGFVIYAVHCFFEALFPKRLPPEEAAKQREEIAEHNKRLKRRCRAISYDKYDYVRDMDAAVAETIELQKQIRGGGETWRNMEGTIVGDRACLNRNRDRAIAYDMPYAPADGMQAALDFFKLPPNFNNAGLTKAYDKMRAALDPNTLKAQKAPKGVIEKAAQQRDDAETYLKLLRGYLNMQSELPRIKELYSQ